MTGFSRRTTARLAAGAVALLAAFAFTPAADADVAAGPCDGPSSWDVAGPQKAPVGGHVTITGKLYNAAGATFEDQDVTIWTAVGDADPVQVASATTDEFGDVEYGFTFTETETVTFKFAGVATSPFFCGGGPSEISRTVTSSGTEVTAKVYLTSFRVLRGHALVRAHVTPVSTAEGQLQRLVSKAGQPARWVAVASSAQNRYGDLRFDAALKRGTFWFRVAVVDGPATGKFRLTY